MGGIAAALPELSRNGLLLVSQVFPCYISYNNVPVNSNWIHPPGQPPDFFEPVNPGHPCLISCPQAKNDGRVLGGGGGVQNFPKLKETAL